MKIYQVIYVALLAVVIGCNSEPRAIQYGQDACHHCKMKLMDPHYGAELVTQKGKIHIFDDLNCLMSFMGAGEVREGDVKHVLVTDYNAPETLTDATVAFYLKSPEFKTPMASGIVAFADYDALKSYKAKHGGVYMAWGELVTQFK